MAKRTPLLNWRVRRLIINADDFGLTPGVNQAIVHAHEHGVVTSSTLMANGAAFENAAQLARSTAKLSVGCHVVLVDGVPVLSPAEVSSLINQSEGRFYEGLPGFATLALLGRLNPEHIEAEATAQIRKLQSAGIEVSHVDTHKHTHVFPQVLGPLLRAAKACGVGAIRNPFEPVGLSSFFSSHPSLWPRYLEIKVLRGFLAKFRATIKELRMRSPQGTFGIGYTGAMDSAALRKILKDAPDETWELVCHPGYNDADLEKIHTRLRDSRVRELDLLTSPATRELLSQAGIEPVSYRDL